MRSDDEILDELGFSPGPYDECVRADGHVYYIRVVRRGTPLRGEVDLTPDSEVALALLVLIGLVSVGPVRRVADSAAKRARKPLAKQLARIPWKIGVIRIECDPWGPIGTRLVHKERHPARAAPTARVAELTEEIRGGRFAEA